MTWIALVRYLGVNWRPFLVVSALGVAAGAFLPPWVVNREWVRELLVSQSSAFPIGVIALTVAALVLGWPRTINYWPRYRWTLALHPPPIQYTDLVASGIFTGVLTGFAVMKFNPNQWTVSNSVYFTLLASLLSFFLWLLSSWVRSYKTIPDNNSPPNRVRYEGDYTDDPIANDEEDLLGRVPFVDRLAAQILKLPSPSSFVFGLYGSWGEGKTSVLRLLQLRLAKTDVITINFNPWYFADETALVQGFYYRIEQELGRIYSLPRLHSTITRYRNRTKHISTSGEHLTFDYQSFIHAFDPTIIYERLERYGEAAVPTLEAKEMAKLFRETYAAEKSGQDKSEK